MLTVRNQLNLRRINAVKRKIYNGFVRNISCTPRINQHGPTGSKEDNISSSKICEEKQQFDDIFPEIVKDLTDSVKHLNFRKMTDMYTKLLEHSFAISSKKTGLLAVKSYKLLEDPQKLTPENIHLAGIMGWCMELVLTAGFMMDDITDNSEMRHGLPSWHKMLGSTAVTDVVFLENAATTILRRYFREHTCFMSVSDLFQDVLTKTLIGQVYDCHISCAGNSNLELFSMDRYRSVAQYKSSYFTFRFPVASAMYLAGIHDAELHYQVAIISRELGLFWQVKNDFLDCFGDLTAQGRTLFGDIREGKCTWPAVVALKRATAEQREVLKRCYGSADEESVEAVMDVYRALDMPTIFHNYQQITFENIRNQMERGNSKLPHKLFDNIFQML